MTEIKFDPNNYRLHSDQNKRIIRKSLEYCGAGRSVLMDKEDVLIAGNGVYEQAQELGLKVRIVESDGTELVVVKRTDLSTEDDKRKLLALADNHSSDTSVFDYDLVVSDFSDDILKDWEFSLDDILIEEFDKENDLAGDDTYTKKIVSPIYEPKEKEKPGVGTLFNLDKYNSLISEINCSESSEEVKVFLRFAATRHIVFDYRNIAEYYAHSDKETQELMEDSALVIIDFNKAIEHGYVNLKKEIADQYGEEYEDDEE